MCTDCAETKLSPWRDFSQDEQRVMRDLLRKMKERPGRRFELVQLRDGRLEVLEVERRVIVGRGAT